jgi:hypothetical protein
MNPTQTLHEGERIENRIFRNGFLIESFEVDF